MRHALHSAFKSAAEYVTGPLSKSQFEEKRVLTPDEFVLAGDYLVRVCPTWKWEGGAPEKRTKYLPDDKQFLVTRSVPCLKRASELEASAAKDEYAMAGDEEGWVATHQDPGQDAAGGSGGAGTSSIPTLGDAVDIPDVDDDDDDDIPDMAELEIDDDDEATVRPPPRYLKAEEPEDHILRTRTYDLSITYDLYYQVPRFWLVGYDESRQPLAQAAVLQDVSEDHARKTITLDPHPHLQLTSAASIHPCRHAEVMKKLADNMAEAGSPLAVEHYLVLFLKFIASVVPTIQYDYTMSVGG